MDASCRIDPCRHVASHVIAESCFVPQRIGYDLGVNGGIKDHSCRRSVAASDANKSSIRIKNCLDANIAKWINYFLKIVRTVCSINIIRLISNSINNRPEIT